MTPQQNNPDLLQLGQDTQLAPAVPPLAVLTAPLQQHEAINAVYYKSSIVNCSMHRTDGKRLPFINGFYKAIIQEDIDYLDNEIRNQNLYISRASLDEVQLARSYEDPLGVIRETIKDDIKREVIEELSLESLEALIMERKKQRETVVSTNKAPSQQTPPPLTVKAAQAAAAAALRVAQQQSSNAAATGASTATLGAAMKAA